MARGRPAKKTQPASEQTPEPAGESTENEGREIDPWEALANLGAGDVVSIQRTWPSGRAAGHLGHLDIDPARVRELPELIKEQFGGGRYLIRWLKRGPDHAGLRFAKGSLPLQIAGDPKLPPEQSTATPTNPLQLLQMPQAAPSSGGDHQQQMLLNLLQGVIDRVGGDSSNVDVVGLVQALQKTVVPQAAPRDQDLLGQAERMLLFFGKMQEFMGSMQPREPAGMLGGGGIENALLAKLLDGGQSQPQMPPPPSPHHVFHPQMGWVLPHQIGGRPPPQNPAPAPPRKQPAEAETRPPPDDDDEDEPPLTPEDIADDIASLSDADQQRLMKIMLAQAEARVANGKPATPTPDASSGGLDLSGTYPIPET